MKTIIVSILMLFVIQFSNLNANTNKPAGMKVFKSKMSNENVKTVKLKITGMTCAGCSNNVSNALKNVDGVIEQSVEYPGNVAIIKYDATKTNPDELIKAIEEAGYKAEIIKEKKAGNVENSGM